MMKNEGVPKNRHTLIFLWFTYYNFSKAVFTRLSTSSLPNTSVIFQMCGPRAAPTRQMRNAFITIPTPYSFSAIHGIIKLSKPSAD